MTAAQVHSDARAVLDYLRKEQGVSGKVGTLGFCWGASMAIQCGADPDIAACGCVHPAFFGHEKEFAEKLSSPLILLPAKGDPMESVKEVVDKKPFGDKCVYQR